MSLSAMFRVRRKESATLLCDETAPRTLPNGKGGQIDNPEYGKTVVVRSATFVSDNEAEGPDGKRGDLNIKGLSAAEYDALSEGAQVTLVVG